MILDVIYPKTCNICGKGKNTYLCTKCEKKLKQEAVFRKDKYEDKFFENHFYIFSYSGIIRNLLLNYKFNERPYLYESFANFFNKYQKTYLQFDFYDIIVPVPISNKRFKIRGYNQSLLFAKEVSKTLNIDFKKDILIKQKENKAQSTLNKEQREENVQNVYKIRSGKHIINKKILLIDDVFTTGATANECSKVLKLAGTQKIDVLTIAKD